jgi:hypothetical protein
MNRTAALYALLSAALFGVSTPAAKVLVGTVDPILLAGLLYCGAGVFRCGPYREIRKSTRKSTTTLNSSHSRYPAISLQSAEVGVTKRDSKKAASAGRSESGRMLVFAGDQPCVEIHLRKGGR